MNWKNKAHILAVLSRIPFGKQIYHKLQRSTQTNSLDAEMEIRKASEIIQMIQEVGRTPANANIVEVGTGWRPFVPMMLSLLNAKSILTIDVNPWLDEEYALETFDCLGKNLEFIAEECQVNLTGIERRYQEMIPQNRNLDALLDSCRIDYLCPGDARHTDLPENAIDFIVSSNVLEHIPSEILSEILLESNRILKSDGLAVHRFNPQDHYSETDSSITGANFLKFSEKEWNWFGGTGLAYHNRLRCRDYEELIIKNGFELQVNRTRLDQDALEAIQSNDLIVHEKYQGYSPEELAADYMWIVAGKSEFKSNNNIKEKSLINKR